MKIESAVNINRDSVIALLTKNKLPVDDLPQKLDNFISVSDNELLIGLIGLEIYNNTGLLRSLVVDDKYRNKKMGDLLVQQLEAHALSLGITHLYLLTETAKEYFIKKNYIPVDRQNVPETIKSSSEFSYVCPVSAVIMVKEL